MWQRCLQSPHSGKGFAQESGRAGGGLPEHTRLFSLAGKIVGKWDGSGRGGLFGSLLNFLRGI